MEQQDKPNIHMLYSQNDCFTVGTVKQDTCFCLAYVGSEITVL